MIGKEMISRKSVPLVQVKGMISERKKDRDLKYEQEQSFKYSKEFSKITDVKAEKLFSELMELKDINERLAVKIVDILPNEMEIMNLLPLKEETVSQETLQKAFEVTSRYLK